MGKWYEILMELQSILQEKTSYTIVVGAGEPQTFIKDNNVVFLIRESENQKTVKSMHSADIVIVQMYIECWTRENGNDIANGYKTLAEMEKQVTTALQQWLMERDNTKNNILKANIVESISDGGSFRPLVGSRTTLQLEVAE